MQSRYIYEMSASKVKIKLGDPHGTFWVRADYYSAYYSIVEFYRLFWPKQIALISTATFDDYDIVKRPQSAACIQS